MRYGAGKPVLGARARVASGHVRVRISDQGPGIPQGEHERIFLPFYRSPGPGDWDTRSSDLGLAIAQGFIEEVSGGRITD